MMIQSEYQMFCLYKHTDQDTFQLDQVDQLSFFFSNNFFCFREIKNK